MSTEPVARAPATWGMRLLVLVPVVLLVAIAAVAIKLSDRGPVFYRQTRVGEGGREFELLKPYLVQRWNASTDGA